MKVMNVKKETKSMITEGQVLDLMQLVEYADGAVVSRTLIENSAGTVTLFAFDADQGLSEHTAPFDALVQVFDGEGEFIIGGKSNLVSAGQLILMPANIPHAVRAKTQFKMMLTMLRKQSA
jgi:quercetin dioxygenase-like cupin family protein